jgi:hypothetical protein
MALGDSTKREKPGLAGESDVRSLRFFCADPGRRTLLRAADEGILLLLCIGLGIYWGGY